MGREIPAQGADQYHSRDLHFGERIHPEAVSRATAAKANIFALSGSTSRSMETHLSRISDCLMLAAVFISGLPAALHQPFGYTSFLGENMARTSIVSLGNGSELNSTWGLGATHTQIRHGARLWLASVSKRKQPSSWTPSKLFTRWGPPHYLIYTKPCFATGCLAWLSFVKGANTIRCLGY